MTSVRYLDHAATSPVRREVLEAMWPYLTSVFGNPASTHSFGAEAARALETARKSIADMLGVRASDLVLTSGGTEADNLAVKGIALATPRGRHVVTIATEHEAVLESCDYLHRFHGFDVSFAPVDGDGVLSPDALRTVLRPDTTLVTVAHANNEIGTVQDVRALAAVAHGFGARFHTDAVQSSPWFDVRVDRLGLDAVSVSGHKFGTPKGIGALALASGVPIEPLVHGGGQQRGRRSGTEDVAAAVGLAAGLGAASTDRTERAERTSRVRDRIVRTVLASVDGVVLTGSSTARLPGHVSFRFDGVLGETVLLELERIGIVSSSGSACAAGSTEPSHVLLGIGLTASEAESAVRLTFDDTLDEATADEVADRVAAAVRAVRAVGGAVY